MPIETALAKFESLYDNTIGTIAPTEASALVDLVSKHQPKSFLEIGTASGVTTGLIAAVMSENGGIDVQSLDISPTFFRDNTKPVGYLCGELFDGETPAVTIRSRTTALHAAQLFDPGTFDMAFIDANHEHPWPTFDLIAIASSLASRAVVVFHDLALYTFQENGSGVGPKHLFDQIPERLRCIIEPNLGNMYTLTMPDDISALAPALKASLLMPWTHSRRISFHSILATRGAIHKFWPPELMKAFDTAVERYY